MSKVFIVVGILVVILFHAQPSLSQTTEFTYQGNLTAGGTPANGSHDFEFLLFDAPSGGTQIGSTISQNNVVVTNGVFSVRLNFGNQFISGANRFLEIKLRPSGQPGITTLSPRQLIGSSPYAIKSLGSLNAESATNALQLGGVGASQYVVTSDPRMSDPRPPIPGSTNYIQNGTSSQDANFTISGSGTADFFNSNLGYLQGGSRLIALAGTTNVFAGLNAGLPNTGTNNAFFGSLSGLRNAAGSNNTFVGSGVGASNVTGNFNTFAGSMAGFTNTASENAFFGYNSGKFNTTGTQNAFFGSGSGNLNTTGSNNSFFGRNAGTDNTIGVSNSFFGHNAGQNNTEGDNNSFFGRSAGGSNTTGFNNSFFGFNAGGANTTGVTNTLLGWNAGRANTTGGGNVFVGWNTGVLNVTGSNNTLIGTGAAVSVDGFSYATAIGSGAVAFSSNSIWLGRVDGQDRVMIPGVTLIDNNATVNGNLTANPASGGISPLCRNSVNVISVCSSSARYKSNIKPFVNGLDLIKRLRPVSFNWKQDGELDLGLVAEDVANVEPLLTTTNENGDVEGVKYDRIGVVLINVVREQQAQIEDLKSQVETLKRLICSQKPRACRSK